MSRRKERKKWIRRMKKRFKKGDLKIAPKGSTTPQHYFLSGREYTLSTYHYQIDAARAAAQKIRDSGQYFARVIPIKDIGFGVYTAIRSQI